MLIDENGNKPEWWQWFVSGLAIVGGALLCLIPGAQAVGVSLVVAGGSSMASNIMDVAGVDSKLSNIISSGLSIVGGIALMFTPFAGIGASMIGAGIGGIAGGYISEALGGSFELGSMIGGFAGSILSGQIYKGLTTTKLYRAIGSVEASSISRMRKFSTGAGQMEGKFFATSRPNAATWGSKLGSNRVVSIRVAKSALTHNTVTYFSRLDGIGAAYYFADMNYLNAIVKILRIL